MSIIYVRGDLLTSSAQALVIPVNCVGVAGCGLALQCKQKYPLWYQAYREVCRQMCLGAPVVHLLKEPEGKVLVSFPTKYHYRDASDLTAIQQGLEQMAILSTLHEITSIAFPKLGCGAGGLSWQRVQPVMEQALASFSREILIYV